MTPAERKNLLPRLEQLALAVEELLLTGLTTATETTRETLNVSFREASKLRLLRLGSTLRVANEELGRFTRNDQSFSRQRLSFFLNRAWLLSHGMAEAIRNQDDDELARLVWTPASQGVDRLDVVTLGVSKRVSPDAFCAFEFRLRTVRASGAIPAGQRLVWSCVFPVKPGVEVPPEGFLHLPQKQEFKARAFLEKKTIAIDKAAVALDANGGGRVSLTSDSSVTAGDDFSEWDQFFSWDVRSALDRVHTQRPGPLDLDVELQEDIVLHDWQIGDPEEHDRDNATAYEISCGGMEYRAVVSSGLEGKATTKAIDKLRKRKKSRPPLFGVMHYEMCRCILQPLTIFDEDGPQYITISDENVDRTALLRTLNFS